VSGAFTCTNSFFGPDPAPGQAKECICNGCDEATTTSTTTIEVTTTVILSNPDKDMCDVCGVQGGTFNGAVAKCLKFKSFPAGGTKCEKFQKQKAIGRLCCGIKKVKKVKPTKAPKVDCKVCVAGTFNPDGIDGNCAKHLKRQGDKCTFAQNEEHIQARCCV
jgi:hypothetical protein